MGRKGISPLIASVLLLAVTLSIAGIFSGWGPGIISSVTEETSNQTDRQISCNEASVEITAAKHYEGENTSVVLRNRGRMDLDDLRVIAFQDDDLPINRTTTSLNIGNFTTINVSTDSKPSYVQVFSDYCSDVKDRHEEIN